MIFSSNFYRTYIDVLINIILLLCLTNNFNGVKSLRERSQQQIEEQTKHVYFSNSSTWGGWSPPAGNDSWKVWIALFSTPNNSRFDSTEEGRDAESGWPRYWKGLGQGQRGVPPPPWAYVPLSYGKPEFCFLQPMRGNCDLTLARWGYNPTVNDCQIFTYSGCGKNQNNFISKHDCIKACVEVPSAGCEAQSKVKFQELLYE